MELSMLDISAFLGITATFVLTLNYLFGMMLGTAYKRSVYWKKLPQQIKKISIYKWHNRTAYIAIVLVMAHPLFLLLDNTTKFRLIDIFFPVAAPTQRLIVAMGTLAMFSFLLVIITSQKKIKKKFTFRTWKNIHLLSYVTALLFIAHGVLMDPELKNRPTD